METKNDLKFTMANSEELSFKQKEILLETYLKAFQYMKEGVTNLDEEGGKEI